MIGQQFARAKLLLAGCSVIILMLSGCASDNTTYAQKELKLDRTDGFEDWYWHAYFHDACGDTQFGTQIRQLIVAKFKNCTFTDEARLRFASKTKEIDATAVNEIEEYYRRRPLPGEAGKQFICSTLTTIWTYSNVQFKLPRYRLGLIGIDEVLPFQCNVKPISFGDDDDDCHC